MPVNSPTSVAYRARWVFPIDGPPIENGIVTTAHGRIVTVGTRTDEANLIELGNVALLPAFINAHTHLEFSLFQQPFGQPGQSFAAWLKQVVAWRREQPAVQGQEQFALAQGLRESEAAGVAVVGEITTPMFAEVWKQQPPLPHVQFLELLSLNAERVPALGNLAETFLQEGTNNRGLSPHAPYTVHPELLARAVRLSAVNKAPLTMHLAESREELELLSSQTGELVDLLKSLSAWYPEALAQQLRPMDYLKTLAQSHLAIIAHGNYLSAEEIDFVAQQRARMSLVYCPRTQAYFNHDPYPLAAMLQAGVRVVVGTDSRASNPDLSIWRELQFIQQNYPAIHPADVLIMGTRAGAEALGVADDFGSIAPGKVADLVTLELPEMLGSAEETLLGSPHPPQRVENFIQSRLRPHGSAD
jgi:cytosine/adenosine deaminase-related metal-dependent hydrolase